MGWLSVGDSYEISLVDGKVAARSAGPRATGRPLRTLPKALRDNPEVDRLRQLAQWLDRHAAECLARVDAWVVSSLPVPTALLARVWPDPAWRDALRDLVVLGDDPAAPGFLRDVTDSGDLRMVDLDGETVLLSPTSARLPHPAHLPALADLREFADELDITQRIEQLHRGIWDRPATLTDRDTTVTDFSGTRVPNRLAVRGRHVRVSGSPAPRSGCRGLGGRPHGRGRPGLRRGLLGLPRPPSVPFPGRSWMGRPCDWPRWGRWPGRRGCGWRRPCRAP
ncbi:conserved hypothetical protein [Micromonospora sp. ATCC 39149]|uniref:DUF4132 domain-containing protein n=1 Tax=Micromonospora sp. (strain ATCC 39149 / NRRL 15099 / SCC 1413) TaxID=219305 RepID=UPI0001A513A9|nr:DUF4132 domain-containing protein [Micromonospora sp. ATCC 39149]EEP70320.1 conserved hypothetical protein [Micromonospora sp. ATCC 39149]